MRRRSIASMPASVYARIITQADSALAVIKTIQWTRGRILLASVAALAILYFVAKSLVGDDVLPSAADAASAMHKVVTSVAVGKAMKPTADSECYSANVGAFPVCRGYAEAGYVCAGDMCGVDRCVGDCHMCAILYKPALLDPATGRCCSEFDRSGGCVEPRSGLPGSNVPSPSPPPTSCFAADTLAFSHCAGYADVGYTCTETGGVTVCSAPTCVGACTDCAVEYMGAVYDKKSGRCCASIGTGLKGKCMGPKNGKPGGDAAPHVLRY